MTLGRLVLGLFLALAVLAVSCAPSSSNGDDAYSVRTDTLLVCFELGDSTRWWSSSHATSCAGGENELDPDFGDQFDGPGGSTRKSARDGVVFTVDRYLMAIVPVSGSVVWNDPGSIVSEEEVGEPPEYRVLTVEPAACTQNCAGAFRVGDTETPFAKEEFCSPGNPEDPICA